MKLYEILNEGKLDKNLSDIYLDVSTPINQKSIDLLYKEYNKLYFRNELPKNMRIKIKAISGAWGVTYYSPDTSIRLEISSKIVKSRKSTIDTLIHEMIHVWQFQRFNDSGDTKYVDKILSHADKAKGRTKSHGAYFHQHMNRLNTKGFDIAISSNVETKVDIDDMYVLVVGNIMVYSPNDIRKHIDVTIDDIFTKVTQGTTSSYSIVKIDDPRILQLPKLTKAGKLKSNSKPRLYKQDFISSILSSGTMIVKDVELDIAGNSDVDDEIQSMVNRANKNFRSGQFGSYLRVILNNVPAYKVIANSIKDDHSPKTHIKGIDSEIIDFIHSEWQKILDREIKKSIGMNAIVVYAIPLVQGEVTPSDVKTLISKTQELNFKDRVSLKDFTKLVYDAMTTKILAFNKKYPGRIEAFADLKVNRKAILEIVQRVLR